METLKSLSFWRKKGNPVVKKHYDHEDFDATFVIPWSIQKYVGLRLNRNDTDNVKWFWDVYYWFEHINLWVATVLDITYMIVQSTQYVEIFLSAPCIGYLVLAIAKSYKMVIHRPVFNNLVSELRDMWPQGVVTDEQDAILKRALKNLNYVVKGYYWCNIGLLVIFLSPSFVKLIYRANGYDTPLVLPYLYWYPFDPYAGGLWYAFALCFEDFHGVTAIIFMVMGDLLFCIFLSHISMQFELLSIRIENLVQKTDSEHGPGLSIIQQMHNESCNTPAWEKLHLKELAAIIERHRALIRLSGDVEEMFSAALLLNFLNSSMIFCFCGFCSVIVEKWNEFSYKSFLFTALAQTYLLCSHGQQLVDSSRKVSQALYGCRWYNASKRVRSSVLIMIIRSQKEIIVTTYGFTVINMACYATKKHYDIEDFDATFAIPWFIQKFVGLRLMRNDPVNVRLFWNIYYWFEHFNMWMAIALDITFMTVRSTRYEEIFLTVPCIGFHLLTLSKSYKMVVYRHVFNNLVSELREMWPQGVVTEEQDAILKPTLKKLNIVAKGYCYFNFMLVGIFLAPSYVALIRRAAGHDTPLFLPYLYWYPFDPYAGGPWYFFALGFEDYHACTADSFVVIDVVLFCIFVSHISMQFDLLSIRIENLVQKTNSEDGSGSSVVQQMLSENCNTPACEKLHLKELADIIERHRALIRLSGDLEDMFSASLLLNFLISSLIFCFCGFCSVIVEQWNEFGYKSFLLLVLGQTYLLCSYGQLLIDSSQKVQAALYGCRWYNASKRVKSTILVMLIRSQKETVVTTYGFTVVNMACYAAILKTAWSYLSLLLNVYK